MQSYCSVGALCCALVLSGDPVLGESGCVSVLDGQQLQTYAAIGLDTPDRSPWPGLSEADGGDATSGLVKRVTRQETAARAGRIRVVAGRNIVDAQVTTSLRAWLQRGQARDLPAWEAGRDGVIIPPAWHGLSADELFRLTETTGDAGRIEIAVLGGVDTVGRTVALIDGIASDASGRLRFVWIYVYQVSLKGRLLTIPLGVCQADLAGTAQQPPLVSEDDERALVDMEQQLTQAWRTGDRDVIERILAPQWAVITANGAKVFRADWRAGLPGMAISHDDAIVTDDITVTQVATTVIVRGRTTVTPADATPAITIRFTDVCVKRDGGWQIVASHHSRASR